MARRALRRARWSILGIEGIARVHRKQYPARGDARKYFDQASVDREVFVFHTSPKYPVYRVNFEATPAKTNRKFPRSTTARVAFLVVNTLVSRSSDHFDTFWVKRVNQRKAIALGKRKVLAEQWRVTSVKDAFPLDFRAVEKDPLFRQYYEEAETYGYCLAFWPNKRPL
jgi:hypothetical protein